MDLPTLTASLPAPTPVARPEAGPASSPAADGENGGFAATLDRKLAEGRQDDTPPETTTADASPGETPATPADTVAAAPPAPGDALLALLATPYAPAPVVVAARPVADDVPGRAARAGSIETSPSAAAGAPETARPLAGATPAARAAAHEPEPFTPSVEPQGDARPEAKRAEAHGLPAFTRQETAALPSVITPVHGHPALGAGFEITAPPPDVAERAITARVGTAGWNDGVAQQVTLMVKDGEQTAQLRLDPPDLGPLEVHLSLEGDEQGVAHVQFVSAHAPVRDALEAALPQLRAALAGSGIMLGQATVGEQSGRGEPQDGPRRTAGRTGGRSGEDGGAPAAVTIRRSGLVDTFA